MTELPPQVKIWGELGLMLAELAVEGARQARKRMRRKRRGAYQARRPGVDTPMWNACAALLKVELQPWGAKVRLARHLGIPKQRVTDFVTNGSRMPDAETLLQIIEWLARRHAPAVAPTPNDSHPK